MIKSKIMKIAKTDVLDDEYIESELRGSGLDPVRWAITAIDDNDFLVSVSYVL